MECEDAGCPNIAACAAGTDVLSQSSNNCDFARSEFNASAKGVFLAAA